MSDQEVEDVTFKELNDVDGGQGEALLKRDVELVGHVTASAEVQIGSLEITIDNLFKLKSGDVLKLKEGVDEPFVLLINGKKIATGNLVVVDDKFGFEVVEII